MPASWTDVANNPEFKSLSPAAQDQARQQYFTDVVEPKAKGENADINAVRDQFFQSTGGPITPESQQEGPTLGPMGAARQQVGIPAQLGHIARTTMGMTENADYTSGTGFGTRYNLRAKDTDAERLTYLKKKYGEGNVQQDPAGRFLVNQNGKWTETGGIAPLSDLAAGVAANPLESAGMVAGAAVPELGFARMGLSGPLMAQKATKLTVPLMGFDLDMGKFGLSVGRGVARGVGAGVGGGVGAVGDELVTGQGLDEAGQRFRDAFMRNMEGDFVFGTVTKPFRSGVYPFLEDQAHRDAANRVIEAGYSPPLSQISSVSKSLPRVQMIGTQAFGFPAADKNIAQLGKDMRGQLKALGLSDAEADAEVKTALQTRGKTSDLAGDIAGSVKGQAGSLQQLIDQAQGRVDTQAAVKTLAKEDTAKFFDRGLQDQLRRVDHLVGAPGNVFEDVQTAIRDGRAKSADAIAPLYDAVDKASGAVVDASRIKGWATDELKQLETAPGEYVGAPPALIGILKSAAGIADTKGGGVATQAGRKFPTFQPLQTNAITYGQMNNLRKNLMQAGWSDELNHANAQRILTNGSHVITDMLHEQEEKAGIGPANQALKQANAKWSHMMDQYDDRLLSQIVKQPGSAGAIDPSKLVDVVFKPGQVDRATRVMRVLPPQQQKQLAAGLVDKIKTTVTKDDGSVDVKKLDLLLGNTSRGYGGVVDLVLGKDAAAQTRKAVADLRRAHADLDAKDLSGVNPVALERLAKAQADWNKYMANNVAHEIAKPSFEGERAIDWLLNKDVTSRVKDFKKMFPPDSPEFQKLQLGFYRKVFGSIKGMDTNDSRKLVHAFDGASGLKELNSYPPGMAEEVLGPSKAAALRDNLDIWARAFPGASGDIQAGLAGGGEAEHLFATLVRAPVHLVGKLGLYQLMVQPGFMRWAVAGMKGDNRALAIATKIGKGGLSGASQGSRRYDDPGQGEQRPQ